MVITSDDIIDFVQIGNNSIFASSFFTIKEEVSSALYYAGFSHKKDPLFSDPVFKIKRVFTVGNTTTINWSGDNFDKAWDDRASLFSPIPFSNLYSLQFDGVNDRLLVANAANINFSQTSQVTFSFWIKSTQTTPNTIFEKRSGALGYTVEFDTSQKLLFELRTADANRIRVRSLLATTAFNGFWHHVAVTYNGSVNASGVSMYVDGSAIATEILNNTLSANPQNAGLLSIGTNQAGGVALRGNLDEISIIDRSLAPQDVLGIYNNGTPTDLSSEASLVLWLRCGDSPQDVFPIIKDQAGNNDATMTNMSAGDIETVAP